MTDPPIKRRSTMRVCEATLGLRTRMVSGPNGQTTHRSKLCYWPVLLECGHTVTLVRREQPRVGRRYKCRECEVSE